MQINFQFASATGHISMIRNEPRGFVNSVFSEQRGRGDATGLMHQIVSYADDRGITLLLTVSAYGREPIMDNEQLVNFYTKFGFIRDRVPPFWPARMTRLPREKNMAHNET